MKKNIIAIVCLLLLAGATYLLLTKDEKTPLPTKNASHFSLSPKAITKIEISRHRPHGNTQRLESVTIEKNAESWMLTHPINYPTEPLFIDNMLSALENFTIVDHISDNPKKHWELQVDKSLGIRVTVTGAKQIQSFIVGVSRQGLTMIRFPDSDRVYRATGEFRNTFDKTARTLRKKTIFTLPAGTVKKVVFHNTKGTLEMVKAEPNENASFIPQGPPIDNFNTHKADSLATALPRITANDYVDSPLPDEQTALHHTAPSVSFDIKSKNTTEHRTLWIGNIIKDKRYVKTSESDQVYLVQSGIASQFIVGRDDFERTDEQAKIDELNRVAAEEHAKMHQGHGDSQGPHPENQVHQKNHKNSSHPETKEIPPHILNELRQKANQNSSH